MEEYGDHDQNSALPLLCKHIAAEATLHVGRVTGECVATLVTAHINASIAIDATADLFRALPDNRGEVADRATTNSLLAARQ